MDVAINLSLLLMCCLIVISMGRTSQEEEAPGATLMRSTRSFHFLRVQLEMLRPAAGDNVDDRSTIGKVALKHCGNKNDAIVLSDVLLQPNPLQMPGKVLIAFKMEVKENLTAPIKFRIDMKKKIPMLFGLNTWVPVPCYDNAIGSCTIGDICDFHKVNLHQMCPIELVQQNISCTCPVLEGSYTVPLMEQEVPRPPAAVDPFFMEGEFRVKFSVYKEHKRLTCYETNAVINI